MKNIIDKIKDYLPTAVAYFFSVLPALTLYSAILLLIAPTTTNRLMTVVFLGLFIFKLWMKKKSN